MRGFGGPFFKVWNQGLSLSPITDLFNGFSRVAGDSYTGGPTVVKDNTGALVTSPANVMAIEGGRYEDGWLSTAADGSQIWPSQAVRTRRGTVPKFDSTFKGFRVDPTKTPIYQRPTEGKLRANNWMVWGRFVPAATQAGWLVSFYTDSNNRAGVYAALTGITFIKIVGGVSTSISAIVNQVVDVSIEYQVRQTENEGMAVRFKPDNGPWSAWVTNTTAAGKAPVVVPSFYYIGSQAGSLYVNGHIPFVMLAQLPPVAIPDILYDRFPTVNTGNYRDLQVVVSSGEINWHQKGTKTSSYRFTKHKMKRTTVAYNPAAGPTEIHNVDTWNLMEAWEVAKTADYTYTTLNGGAYLANSGAWENAIRERGATNFIGSHKHGNEVLSAVEFAVDGAVKDLATAANYTCKRFTMTQTSTLYRCNTLTPVATRVAVWDVTPDGITVTQDFSWSENMTIDSAYLAMLPIRRTFDDTDTGAVVTNRAARNPDYAEEDVSMIGFPIVNTVGTTAAKAWGTTSGISAELELLETPNFPNNNFHITNAAVYNKMYFDVTGNGHVVTAGDTWRVKARYLVTTSN